MEGSRSLDRTSVGGRIEMSNGIGSSSNGIGNNSINNVNNNNSNSNSSNGFCFCDEVDLGCCESPSPLDCCHQLDPHSSEEELEVINSATTMMTDVMTAAASAKKRETRSAASAMSAQAEKRKWAQANRLSVGGGASSTSSDDEVRELMCCSASSLPLQFRTSPPADAYKPTQSPPAKLLHFAAASLDVSPRKRHRQSHSATPTPRPCLDFEKMQQLRTRAVTAWRPSREVSLIC